MTKSRILLIAITFILFAIGMVLILDARKPEPAIQACTKELKVCPDGSTVGRTEPNCAFAKCPSLPEPVKTIVAIRETIQLNGVSITPLRVISDSRCPANANCIWAGTVVLETMLEQNGTSKTVELTLNKSFEFGGSSITLVSVAPQTKSTDPIQPEEYRFEFAGDAD